MANRQHFDVQASQQETKLVYGSFVGNGTSAPTVVGGDVVSVARSGVGVLVVTLRHPYTAMLMPVVACVGPTLLRANITAQAVTSTTTTISFTLVAGAATATDATTSDTVYIKLAVRNGG